MMMKSIALLTILPLHSESTQAFTHTSFFHRRPSTKLCVEWGPSSPMYNTGPPRRQQQQQQQDRRPPCYPPRQPPPPPPNQRPRNNLNMAPPGQGQREIMPNMDWQQIPNRPQGDAPDGYHSQQRPQQFHPSAFYDERLEKEEINNQQKRERGKNSLDDLSFGGGSLRTALHYARDEDDYGYDYDSSSRFTSSLFDNVPNYNARKVDAYRPSSPPPPPPPPPPPAFDNVGNYFGQETTTTSGGGVTQSEALGAGGINYNTAPPSNTYAPNAAAAAVNGGDNMAAYAPANPTPPAYNTPGVPPTNNGVSSNPPAFDNVSATSAQNAPAAPVAANGAAAAPAPASSAQSVSESVASAAVAPAAAAPASPVNGLTYGGGVATNTPAAPATPPAVTNPASPAAAATAAVAPAPAISYTATPPASTLAPAAPAATSNFENIPILSLSHADAIADNVIHICRRNKFNPVTVYVLDASGSPLVSKRMDGCSTVGVPDFAKAKAYSCVVNKYPSRAFRDRYTKSEESAKFGQMLGMVSISGNQMAPFPGGIVLKAGEHVVGAVGVSGASGDEDEYCAIRGVVESNIWGLSTEPVEHSCETVKDVC